MVRESIWLRDLERNARGDIRFDEAGDTSTDGRWVARSRWMPVARAICARRTMEPSTSRPKDVMRSAISSMPIKMKGSASIGLASVIAFDIAAAGFLEYLVAPFHFRYRPPENADGFFILGDDGPHEVGDAVVDREFHALRIDEHELQRLRRIFI